MDILKLLQDIAMHDMHTSPDHDMSDDLAGRLHECIDYLEIRKLENKRL